MAEQLTEQIVAAAPKFEQNKKSLDEMKFFFILGRGRSGTTLIRTLLDAHPNLHVPPESVWIIDLYRKYRGKKFTPERIKEFFRDVCEDPKFELLWDIDKEKLLADLTSIGDQATFQDCCKIVYLNYKSFYTKKNILWIGDKNPAYSLHAEELISLFPQAKFIFITRDYRDNIISQKRIHSTAVKTTAALSQAWRMANKALLSASKKYPSQYYRLKYEDLATNPEPYLKEICTFLSVDYFPEMLDFYKKIDTKHEKIKDIMAMHQNLVNPVNTQRMNLWQKQMSEKDILKADYLCHKLGKQLGYEPYFTSYGSSLFFSTMPGVVYSYLSTHFFETLYALPVGLKRSLRLFLRKMIHAPSWDRLTKGRKDKNPKARSTE